MRGGLKYKKELKDKEFMGYYDFKETKCSTCQYYCGKRRLEGPFHDGSGIVCDESSGLCCCRYSKNNAKTVSEKDWCWKYEQWTVISQEIAKKEYAKVENDRRKYERTQRDQERQTRKSDDCLSNYRENNRGAHNFDPYNDICEHLTSTFKQKELELKNAQTELRGWKWRPLSYAILSLIPAAFLSIYCLVENDNILALLFAGIGLCVCVVSVTLSFASKKSKNKIAELTSKVAICKEETEQAKARLLKFIELGVESLTELSKKQSDYYSLIDHKLDEMIKNETNNAE